MPLTEQEVLSRIEIDGRYAPAPDFVFRGVLENITLICDKHGRFEILLNNLCYKDGTPKKGCIECGRIRTSSFHRSTQEEILKRIKIDGRYTPASDFKYVNNHTPVSLICPKHGQFMSNIQNICFPDGTSKKHGCKKCANEAKSKSKLIPNSGESLNDLFPEISKWWSPENEKSPTQVNPFANYKAKFDCKVCGETFESQISSVTIQYQKKGRFCPYCSNKLIRSDYSNSLAKTHPDLALEWHEENDFSAREITSGSEYRAKWSCSNIDCNHEWYTTVYSRTGKKKTGCARCSISGFDSSKPAVLYLFVVKSENGEILFYKLGISNNGSSRRFREFSNSVSSVPRWANCTTSIVSEIEYELGGDALKIEKKLKDISDIRYYSRENYVGKTESFIVNPVEYARELEWL